MNAPQKPKRRHHHVWQYYLKPWTVGGTLYCLQEGRIFRTGTRAVAVEKDFYKLYRLTAEDIALVKRLFGQGHPSSVRAHANLLNSLMMPFQIAEQLKNGPHREQIDASLDDYASNVLEDHHASIEVSFLPALDSALKGDISFYADDERCIPFLNYLCTQYMRTKGIKERVLASSPFLERLWNIIIHMSATNVGASLYSERKRRALIIVNNRTDVPFITGDQPAINLKGTRPDPPDRLSIFYPIAPHAALLMADVGDEPPFPAEGLTRNEAKTLNQMLIQASYKQVFGRTEECLRALA
jgi:hypothetical protein